VKISSRPGFFLGRDRPDASQYHRCAQLVSHCERGVGASKPFVELLGRIERPARGQGECDQRELDRPEYVSKIATAGIAQSLRRKVADRVKHHAPRTQPSRFVNLLPDRSVGVES